MKEILTVHPTLEEMQMGGLVDYIERIQEQHPTIGAVKVVTPPEWRALLEQSQPAGTEQLDFIIANPILQRAVGERGAYQFALVTLEDTTLREFEIKSHHAKQSHIGKLRGNHDLAELERAYWKNISYVTPEYGADMQGSIFGDAHVPWNTNTDLLNVLSALKVEIPGVNSSYLYVGQMFSTFCWHVEDKDLYAVNYMHFGEPKTWYSIPIPHAHRFELLAQELFPSEARKCPSFLRHKTTMISPALIENCGIPLETCRQFPGEFVINLPRGYHCGFSHGFNCAESINFAAPRWLPLGRDSTVCYCDENTINIDVEELADRYQCLIKSVELEQQIHPNADAVQVVAQFRWAQIFECLEKFSKMVSSKEHSNDRPRPSGASHNIPEKRRRESPPQEIPMQPPMQQQDSPPMVGNKRWMSAHDMRPMKPFLITDSAPVTQQTESAFKFTHYIPPSKRLRPGQKKRQHTNPNDSSSEEIQEEEVEDEEEVEEEASSEEPTEVCAARDPASVLEHPTNFQDPPLEHPTNFQDPPPRSSPLVASQVIPQSALNVAQRDAAMMPPLGPLTIHQTAHMQPSNRPCRLVPVANVTHAAHSAVAKGTPVKALDAPCKICLEYNGMEHPLDMKYVALKKYLRSHSQIPFSAIRPCHSLADLHAVYHEYPSAHPSFGPCPHQPDRRLEVVMMYPSGITQLPT